MATDVNFLAAYWRALLVTVLPLLIATASFASEPPSTREVDRLEELGRIWIYLDLFDPQLATHDVDWDQALLDAIPKVRNARDRKAHINAINAMLKRSGDPVAEAGADDQAQDTEGTVSSAFRKEAGVQIADCRGLVRAVANDGATPTNLAGQIVAQPTVVDCRAFRGDYATLAAVIDEIGRSHTSIGLPRGSSLVRSYSGFPTEGGMSSGGYTRGVSFIDLGSIASAESAVESVPLVFLIDGDIAPFVIPTIAALQAAGRARVVGGDRFGANVAFLHAGRLNVAISEGIYVYPNGRMGFRADATPPEQAALATAIAQLSAGPSSVSGDGAVFHQRSPRRSYTGGGAPPLEQRLLALFRFWGTVKYFYVYKNLMERSWEDNLREFIPIFMAADTRQAYETAVLALGARMQDSHSSVGGLTATHYGVAPARPAFLARYIEGRLAVVALYDTSLADRLNAGDELIAIDRTPIATLEHRLSPLVAASTPQAFRSTLARRLLSGARDSVAELQVRGASGGVRTVRVPRTMEQPPAPPGPAWRLLDDDIGYINLEQLRYADADRALDELIKTKSLILDLRGYPQGTAWALGRRFAHGDKAIRVARFRRPLYQGPPDYEADQPWWATFEQTASPAATGRYGGRLFVLIDERAISQSEHTALFFKAAAGNVTFVGSPTNGTDGDVTSVSLPGGLRATFTGHDVTHADGSQLQRIGIQPDVPVSPSLQGLRAGRDEVLDRALELARK